MSILLIIILTKNLWSVLFNDLSKILPITNKKYNISTFILIFVFTILFFYIIILKNKNCNNDY